MKTNLFPFDFGLILGCQCQVENDDFEIFEGTLMGIDGVSEMAFIDWGDDSGEYPIADVKPILRRLESMTFEDREKIGYQEQDRFEELWKDGQISKNEYCAWMFPILLQGGYDIFNWIDVGLAIDAETLKK